MTKEKPNGHVGGYRPWVDFNTMKSLLRFDESYVLKEPIGYLEEAKVPSAKDLIDGAEVALDVARMVRVSGSYSWAFAPAYCSMFYTAKALVSNAGLLSPGYTDSMTLIKIGENFDLVAGNMPSIREELLWMSQLSIRTLRNGIIHSGLNHTPRNTVNETITNAEQLLLKARKIIEAGRPIQLTVPEITA